MQRLTRPRRIEDEGVDVLRCDVLNDYEGREEENSGRFVITRGVRWRRDIRG